MSYDWLLPALTTGMDMYDAYSQGQSNKDYADLLADREQWKYDQAKESHDAYSNYMNMANGIAQGNAAAANARAGAIAGAFNAAEQRRIGASKKGKKDLKRTHKRAISYLTPYRVAGESMIAPTLNMFNQGVEGLNLMNAYMQTPEQMAKMNQSGPILDMSAGLGQLPEWMLK